MPTTVPRFFREADGRWIAAAIVGLFFLALKIASLVLHVPIFELPPFSWFGPMAPYFADLYGITAGTERLHAGIPPSTATLHDPWNRPFNYPFWWLFSDYIGLNTHTIMAFGYGMGVLFFVSAFYAVGRLTAGQGAVVGFFLVSYAVMFGVERANIDLVIFALAAGALALRRHPFLAALVITLAAYLKLYPIFALFALWVPPWKKTVPWIGMGVLLFIEDQVFDFSHVFSSMGHAPNMHTSSLSFGTVSWGIDFIDRFHCPPSWFYEFFVAGTVLFIVLVSVGAWNRPQVTVESLNERDVFAFRLGASLYLGTFVMGTNHDYRMIVFLFCLPLLFRLMKEPVTRSWALVTLLLILACVHWKFFSGETAWHHFLLKQAAAWALVVYLAGLCIATLPPDLQWPKRPVRS